MGSVMNHIHTCHSAYIVSFRFLFFFPFPHTFANRVYRIHVRCGCMGAYTISHIHMYRWDLSTLMAGRDLHAYPQYTLPLPLLCLFQLYKSMCSTCVPPVDSFHKAWVCVQVRANELTERTN